MTQGPGQWVGLAVFIVLCLGVGVLGGSVTARSLDAWYRHLHRPVFAPPNWIFGPAWTALYVLMAVAAWWVWREHGLGATPARFTLFAIQLALSLAWNIIFFGMRRPDLALVDIAILWAAILATLVAFWRVEPVSGALLVPYLAWVSYAAVLNFEFWRLNRGTDRIGFPGRAGRDV